MQLVNLQMNELEEVEGTNKKINKQQGLQSSNVQQAAGARLGSMQLVNLQNE